MTSVVIPSSVTNIGNSAFAGCGSLASVDIPSSVTSIGENAFEKCTSLTNVVIPNYVTSLKEKTFYGCTGLHRVTIGSGVQSIAETAFAKDYRYNGYNYYYTRLSLEKVIWLGSTPPEGYKNVYGEQEYASNDAFGLGTKVYPLLNSMFEKDGIMYVPVNTSERTCDAIDYVYDIASVKIPSKVLCEGKDYNVIAIGDYAFANCNSLVSVEIPSSVTSIGELAFSLCTSLASVVIPNSVTKIGREAFENCTSLTSVAIPGSVTSIGYHVFWRCDNLFAYQTNTDLTATLLRVGNSLLAADNSCKNAYHIPDKITHNGKDYVVDSIGNGAFEGCTSLASVVIPNSVTNIGNSAFAGCGSLASVDIPSSVTSIGNAAFQECRSLASVVIPNSVKSIGWQAFCDCYSLASVDIPNSVDSIGRATFYNCRNLAFIAIPSSVTSIGQMAFYGCNSLASVVIPNSVTKIGSYAFKLCRNLASIVIPNSVTDIGEDAFTQCYSLHSITIGNGVPSVANVFRNGVQPKKVIWLRNTPPEGYKNVNGTYNYVSNDSFTGLSNTRLYPFLSSMFEKDGIKYVPVSPSERTCDVIDCAYDSTAANIYIGRTVNYKGVDFAVKSIRSHSSYDNTFIKSLKIDYDGVVEDSAFYDCRAIMNACIAAKTIGASAFANCATVNPAKFEIMVDTIRDNAFTGCSKMEDAVLGENLKSIGNSAFKDCSSLKGITIPDSVKSIDYHCFSGCESLSYVKIGAGLDVIQGGSFNGCRSLPEITIPPTVSRVGDYVFSGCTSLADVTIADRDTDLKLGSNGSNPMFSSCPLKSVYIGGNITYNATADGGNSPFCGNASLEAVKITGNVTEMLENEFNGCTNLNDVIIPNSVKSIGGRCFAGCKGLNAVLLGTGLKSIGDEAFSGCTALKKLVSKTAVPPVCGSQALDDINKWECTLYVPQESLDAYKSAAQWKEFFFLETGIKNVSNTSSSATESARYSTDGTRIASPQKGINIIRMSDGTVKKVLVK